MRTSKENNLKYWEKNGTFLKRTFKFSDFVTAFGFMTAVAEVAEEMNHHPTWTNTYNEVAIELTTHEVGEVTSKDTKLATKIDKIYNSFS